MIRQIIKQTFSDQVDGSGSSDENSSTSVPSTPPLPRVPVFPKPFPQARNRLSLRRRTGSIPSHFQSSQPKVNQATAARHIGGGGLSESVPDEDIPSVNRFQDYKLISVVGRGHFAKVLVYKDDCNQSCTNHTQIS